MIADVADFDDFIDGPDFENLVEREFVDVKKASDRLSVKFASGNKVENQVRPVT